MAIINVSNANQLDAALKAAKGGDVINLAAGSYGNFWAVNIKPTSRVIIQSADPTNPAHFDQLQVRSGQNLTFRGLDIGRALAANEADYTQLTSVRDSSTIVFDGNHIHGSLDGNAQNDGYGLLVNGVSGLTLINNTFEQLTRGAIVSRINNLYVADNKFLDMRSDGLDVDGSKNILIERNLFKGFFPLDYDHPDMMQFHNIGHAEPTENVTIRNNMLLPGGGYDPQGVWISDPDKTGFRNITVENNLLWGKGSYNGIGFNGVVGGKIIGNTILSSTDDNKTMWIRIRHSSDIDMIRNVSEDIYLETNYTNVRISESVNLKTNPELRALMANPENPSGWADILMPGAGATIPKTVADQGPISGAVSSALSDMLSPNRGQAFMGAVAIDGDSVAGDGQGALSFSLADELAGQLASIFDPSPASAELDLGEFSADYLSPADLAVPSEGWRTAHQDWFVALP